jgi:hypothetical protein
MEVRTQYIILSRNTYIPHCRCFAHVYISEEQLEYIQLYVCFHKRRPSWSVRAKPSRHILLKVSIVEETQLPSL